MRKNVNELIRIQNVIESDRLNTGNGFEELLIGDLSRLLKDYFDFSTAPEIKIFKNKGAYRLDIGVDVARIRALNYLPKENQ